MDVVIPCSKNTLTPVTITWPKPRWRTSSSRQQRRRRRRSPETTFPRLRTCHSGNSLWWPANSPSNAIPAVFIMFLHCFAVFSDSLSSACRNALDIMFWVKRICTAATIALGSNLTVRCVDCWHRGLNMVIWPIKSDQHYFRVLPFFHHFLITCACLEIRPAWIDNMDWTWNNPIHLFCQNCASWKKRKAS